MNKPKKARLCKASRVRLIMDSAADVLIRGKKYPHALEYCKGQLQGLQTALTFFDVDKEAKLIGEMWQELHEYTA